MLAALFKRLFAPTKPVRHDPLAAGQASDTSHPFADDPLADTSVVPVKPAVTLVAQQPAAPLPTYSFLEGFPQPAPQPPVNPYLPAPQPAVDITTYHETKTANARINSVHDHHRSGDPLPRFWNGLCMTGTILTSQVRSYASGVSGLWNSTTNDDEYDHDRWDSNHTGPR